MRRILLTRHGQTAWNKIGRLQGHSDIELDETGRTQARALATSLAAENIASVWTSDLARARETGAIVAAALGLDEPRVDPDLRERRFGLFEGLTRAELEVQHPEALRAWIAHSAPPPGGETRESVVERMQRVLARLAEGDGGSVLVVSHGAAMRLWLMHVLGESIPLIENGRTFVIDHDVRGMYVRPPSDER